MVDVVIEWILNDSIILNTTAHDTVAGQEAGHLRVKGPWARIS